MPDGAFQAGFPPQFELLRPSTRIPISRNHQQSHEESSFSRPSSQGWPAPMGWGRLGCLEPCAGHGHKFSWQPATLHSLRSRDPILGQRPGSCPFQLGGTWHPIQAMGQGLSVPAHSRTVWPVPKPGPKPAGRSQQQRLLRRTPGSGQAQRPLNRCQFLHPRSPKLVNCPPGNTLSAPAPVHRPAS